MASTISSCESTLLAHSFDVARPMAGATCICTRHIASESSRTRWFLTWLISIVWKWWSSSRKGSPASAWARICATTPCSSSARSGVSAPISPVVTAVSRP